MTEWKKKYSEGEHIGVTCTVNKVEIMRENVKDQWQTWSKISVIWRDRKWCEWGDRTRNNKETN